MDFRLSLRTKDDRLVITVSGELDDAAGSQLREVVDEALGGEHPVVVLDLAGITFMDSRGLGQLLAAHQALEEAGRQVVVANPSVHADRVLRSAGLSDRLQSPRNDDPPQS